MSVGKNLNEAKDKLLSLDRHNKAINFKFENSSGKGQCVEISPDDCHELGLHNLELQNLEFNKASLSVKNTSDVFECTAIEDKRSGLKGEVVHAQLKNGRTVKSKPLFDIFKNNYQKQHSVENERGFNPTKLAFCFFEFQNGDAIDYAPCLLLPARFERQNKSSYSLVVNWKDEFVQNYSIQKYFEKEFKITLPKFYTETEIGSITEAFEIIAKLEDLCKADASMNMRIVRRFCVSSSFAVEKQTLYEEIEKNESVFEEHSILQALFNGEDAKIAKDGGEMTTDEYVEYIDRKISSQHFFNILDADSSQMKAISDAIDGKNFVIQGPPGTGKTQTISNIISNLVMHNKKVLFVAEKKVAIEAVLKKFEDLDISEVFLDLHSTKTTTKSIIEQCRKYYNKHQLNAITKTADAQTQLSQLDRTKGDMWKFYDTIYNATLPCGKTAKQVMEVLLEMEHVQIPHVQIRQCYLFSKEKIQHISDILQELEGYRHIDEFWLKAQFNTQNITVEHKEELDYMIERFHKVRGDISKLEAECVKLVERKSAIANHLLSRQINFDQIGEILATLKECLQIKKSFENCTTDFNNLTTFQRIFTINGIKLRLNVTRQAKIKATQFNNIARKINCDSEILYRQIELIDGNPHASNPHTSNSHANIWQDSTIDLLHNIKEIEAIAVRIVTSNHEIETKKQEEALIKASVENIVSGVDDFPSFVLNLQRNMVDIIKASRFFDIYRKLCNEGLSDIFTQCRTSDFKLSRTFQHSVYKKVIEAFFDENFEMKNTAKIEEVIAEFQAIDRHSFEVVNLQRIKQSLRTKAQNSSLLRKLSASNSKVTPRKLIERHRNEGESFDDVFGCVVCSPITISRFFELTNSRELFDCIIFDESSQIFSHDAYCAIVRAKNIIIAGDSNQMPPSNYFGTNYGNDDESKEDDIIEGDYKSLLDLTNTTFPSTSLRWHYRSKFEELIHPSNHNIYNNTLITFPTAEKNDKAIETIFVENGTWVGSVNEAEATTVVGKLRELFESGEKSVGVIAMNIKQSGYIRTLVEQHDDLSQWYASDELFLKNLENCQGDERDIIIISLTFAKRESGSIGKIDGHVFSQINKAESERRLNVAFTRAKSKVYLVTSITSSDIENKHNKISLQFLKYYLDFARNCTKQIAVETLNHDEFDSKFEEQVCNAMRKMGYRVHTQIGCSGYKVDLGIVNPNNDNHYILGIECDGDRYHTGAGIRERDRLRQEILESKGWKILRIWASDWCYDKPRCLAKIQAKLENIEANYKAR